MDPLVRPSRVKSLAMACHHNVPKRDGGGAAAYGYAIPQNGGDEWPVDFQHSADDLQSAARQHGTRDEQQAEERIRQRPQVSSEQRQHGCTCDSHERLRMHAAVTATFSAAAIPRTLISTSFDTPIWSRLLNPAHQDDVPATASGCSLHRPPRTKRSIAPAAFVTTSASVGK
jgi:hypothetical protein